MATKINPLDFGKVKDVTVTVEHDSYMTMTVIIEMELSDLETTEIIRDALMDSLHGK